LADNKLAGNEVAAIYKVDLAAESKTAVWTTEGGRQVRDREAEARLARAKASGRLKKGRKLTRELRLEMWQLSRSGPIPVRDQQALELRGDDRQAGAQGVAPSG
jgi:hypothetical protein